MFAVRLEIWFKIIIPLASCIYVEKLYICSDYHTQEASGKPAKTAGIFNVLALLYPYSGLSPVVNCNGTPAS